ncbi:hypothetical protein Csa_023862, partial [Cucumis sativus]
FISKKLRQLFNWQNNNNFTRESKPAKENWTFFFIGDQGRFPWKWKICPPDFINLQILPHLVKRMKSANIMTILGSKDIIVGEVDL